MSRARAWLLAAVLLGAAAPATAEIRVEVEGVGDAIRANVLAYLSLARYATLDDLSDEVVNRLHQRVEREVADALRPFGYYAPSVQSDLVRRGRDWQARIVVAPGEPVILKDVDVEIAGPGRDEPFLREVLDNEALQPGQPLNHGTYEALKGDLQRRATSSGYLDAHYTAAELLVDPAKREAVARLRLETGARYRFGATEIEQDVLDAKYVRRFLRFQEGDWYSSGALLRTQFALDDTAYFGAVEVLPGDRDPQALTVPVRIQASRNERDKYSIGVGYETDFGPRVRFGWERRYLNRKGHRLRFETNVARKNQSGGATYLIPIGDPALEKVELNLIAANDELGSGDTAERSVRFRPSITRVLANWQRVQFVDFLHSQSRTGTARATDTLVVPGISFAPVPRGFGMGNALDATSGFYVELLGSQRALGSRANFLRFRARDDWRWRLAPKWSLLARAEVGTTAVKNFDELPPQYRFFAGGDRSVRGFGFNTLSPRVAQVVADPATGQPKIDATTGLVETRSVRTGGKHLLVGSVELEHDLPRSFAVAVFTDVGNAFNSFGDPLEYSVGVGVRYKLPFVSVGLDVAQALSESTGPRLHLNITPVFTQ